MLGEINLNNAPFGNLLNNSMISSLHRTLMALELDENTNAIILRGEKDFILGTDYLCKFYLDLAHKGQENPSEAEEYLRRLYSMIFDISRLETPFIPLVNGRAFGSGATIAGLSHFGIANERASARFPETGFGFIPTGGSTYLLSRMPGEVGTYLALTGKKLLGSDLKQLDIVTRDAEISDSLIVDMASFLNTRYETYNTKITFGDSWKENFEMMKANTYFQNAENTQEIANRLNISQFWRERRENTKMTVADVIYNSKLRKDAIESSPGIKYRDFGGQEIHNHLSFFESSALRNLDLIQPKPLTIQEYLPAIYRCFSAGTLDEVIERLVHESNNGEKEWAKSTLAILAEKSPLSLEVTFRLVKNAYYLEWNECLQKEFQVALNMCKTPEFFEGATKVLGRITQTPDWPSKSPISPDQISEILHNSATLELDSKPHQLLPVKEYFRDFPNTPRFWLNEISPTLTLHRKDFEFEATAFFNGYGVDLRDPNIDIPTVRSKVFHQLVFDKRMENEYDRVKRISSDPLTTRMYIEQRVQEIENFIANEKEFKESVKKVIEKRFREKFEKRYELAVERCTEAHNIKKREFLKELKDVISEKIFMQALYDGEVLNNKFEVDSTAPVPMHIPLNNDESYLPAIINKKYDQYPIDPEFYYTADLASTEDYGAYYQTRNSRFSPKMELNPENMKDYLTELYIAIGLVKEYEHTDDYEMRVLENINDDVFYEKCNKFIETKPGEKKIQNEPKKEIKTIEEIIKKDIKDVEQIKNSLGLNDFKGFEELAKVPGLEILKKFTKANQKEIDVDDPDHEKFVENARYIPDETDLSGVDSDEKLKEFPRMPVTQNYLGTDLNDELFGKEELLVELAKDIYVKTGCESPSKGLHLLKTGQFEYDPEAMKERRRKITHFYLQHDDKYYMATKGAKKAKFLFSDFFITPSPHDIDKKMLQTLEFDNSKLLLNELEVAREKRYGKKEKAVEKIYEELGDIEDYTYEYMYNTKNQELKVLDFAHQAKFDAEYLKMIFGDKVTIPVELDFNKEDLEIPAKVLGLCDYRQTPHDWVQKALKDAIDHLFDQREIEEKIMNHSELAAYDCEISEKLTPQGIKTLLLDILNQETSLLMNSLKDKFETPRIKDDESISIFKPSNEYQEILNKDPEYLLTRETYDLRNYMDRTMNAKRADNDIHKTFHSDPYYQVLAHERDNKLLTGPKKSINEYLEIWQAKPMKTIKEKRKENTYRKRALEDLKRELIQASKVIKSMEKILDDKQVRAKPEILEEFKEILEANKSIL